MNPVITKIWLLAILSSHLSTYFYLCMCVRVHKIVLSCVQFQSCPCLYVLASIRVCLWLVVRAVTWRMLLNMCISMLCLHHNRPGHGWLLSLPLVHKGLWRPGQRSASHRHGWAHLCCCVTAAGFPCKEALWCYSREDGWSKTLPKSDKY